MATMIGYRPGVGVEAVVELMDAVEAVLDRATAHRRAHLGRTKGRVQWGVVERQRALDRGQAAAAELERLLGLGCGGES